MAQTNGNGVNMHELNDEQKTWLTQMSYLNINEEGRKKLERGESIKVSELDQYLDAPDKPWCGNGGFGNKIANFASQVVVNRDAFETQGEMVEKLNQLGLGDIEITNASKEHQFGDSGFQALTFKDSYDNVGISFRGSDLDAGRGYMDDWIRADLGEFTKGDSQQMRDALKYFDQNKDQDGQTMLFGHSLGGQLSSHVLCERTDEVKQAFVINANPINSNRLDTPEKQAAFNDPEKYSFNAVAGDLVSHFKAHHGYEGNVNYVSNNHSQPNNIVGAHVVQAASFDENGNFIKATEGEIEKEMGGMRGDVAKFMNNLRDRLNEWEQKVQEDPGIIGNTYRAAKTHQEASIQAKETFKEFRQDFREAVSGGFGEMLNKMHLDKERLQEKGRSIAEGFQKVGQQIGIEDIGKADIDGFTMVGGAVGGIGGAVLGHEIGESIGDALQQDGLLEGFEMPDIMKSAQDMLQDIEQRMDIPGIDMQALAHEAQDLLQDIGNNNVIQDIGETFEQGLSELGDFVNDIGDEIGFELGD